MADPILQRSLIAPFPANETERLAALHRYKILDTPAEAAFDRITTLAARLFRIPTVLISLVDESRAWFKSCIGFDAREVPRDATICSFAVLTDQPLIVPDTRLDDRFACNPFVQCEPGLRFYAGAPLLSHDGFNLGTLCMLDTQSRDPLTAEQQATLVDLAAIVVDELELRLAAHRIAQVDDALLEITQGVAAVTGVAFADALVQHFAKVLDTDYVYIGLIEDDDPKIMRTIATCAHGQIVDNLEYPLQDTPCWATIEQRKICCYPRNVQAQFPNAPLLKPLSVESYVAIPFFDSNGNVLGLLGVMDRKPLENVNLAESLLTIFVDRIATEIERQQAEDDLRQTQAIAQRQLMEIEAIYQTAPIGLAILDPDLRYERINQRLAEINGISMADHIGHTVRDIVPDLADENEPLLRQVLATGEPLLNLEISGETSAQPGIYRTWIENCYPLKDETGRSIGINVVVQEITDRKQAEADLQESKMQFDFLLEAAQFGDWNLNLRDHTAYRSLRHDQIFGYESLLSEWTYEMFLAHVLPEEREEVDRQYQSALDNNEPWDFECRICRADNQMRWIWVSGYVYQNAEGEASRMLGLVADITDRKQVEAALEERNKELDSFVHTVSHDLKAPLRAISNLSEWIEDDLEGQLPPDNQQQLQLLRTRVKRMESMINSLLVYARTGRQAAPLETFNVAELLREIIDSLDPPQSFSIKIEQPMPRLTTKRLFLSQVFANLISNAIKHHTSAEGYLNISAIEHRDFYEFIVRDDGPGIESEDHARIFEIFQALKIQDNGENTGVGLAIVKKIIEREKGTIRLESRVGDGTTFFFTWPKHHS
jgi:PAS domain S-box-containing protein